MANKHGKGIESSEDGDEGFAGATSVFRSFQDFRILDSIDTRYTVVDWTPGQKRFVWGNKCTLNNFGMSLEKFQDIDMMNQSKAANDYCQEIFEQTQQQKKTVTRLKTAYPGGKPVTSRDIYKPIETDLPIIGEPRTLVLMCMLPVDDDQQSKVAAHAEEVLRYAEVLAMIYDPETLALEYENGPSKAFYEPLSDPASRTLNDVIDTCIWESDAQKVEVLGHVKALTLQSPKIDVECKKRRTGNSVESELWHRLIFIPVINPEKGQFSILVSEYDISELKKVQHDLVQTNLAQEQFFAAISHELRTPLNGIIGLSSSIMSDPTISAHVAKTLKIIKSSGMRLSGLVNDILDAASSKRDTLVIKHEQVVLSQVAASVCDCLDVLVRKGVQIVNAVPTDLPVVEGDAGRLTQILTNLLSNAIKFTEKGHIKLGGAVAGPVVHVWCEDTGIGIPADKLPGVWGAFQQVDKATTRKYGGTGLGLSLVRSLVEAHGGSVWVESKTAGGAHGSTFFFSLPILQDARRADPPPAARAQPPPSPAPAPAPASAPAVQPADELAPSGGAGGGFKLPPREALRVGGGMQERKRRGSDRQARGELGKGGVQTNGGREEGRGEGGSASGRGSPGRRVSLLPPPVAEGKEALEAAVRGECERCEELRRRSSEVEQRCRRLEERCRGLEERARQEREQEARQRSELGSLSAGSEASGAPFVGGFHFKPSDEDCGKGQVILSVDDDMVNIAVLRSMLEPLGFSVETRSSGAAALQYLDTCKELPDVILLDNMMPVMSGIEVVRKIRQRFAWTELPVIMVSAKANTDDIIEGLETGANDYVTKPFNRNELLARIAKQGDIKKAIKLQFEARHRCLLEAALPIHVIDSLPGLPCARVDRHDAVSLMHLAVSDFDALCAAAAPAELVAALNRIVQAVETLCDRYQCFKVAVSCSSYLVVAGHEGRWGRPDHPDCLLHLAADLLGAVGSQALERCSERRVELEVAVHHGTVMSAVVGVHTPLYTVFGETARVARDLMRFAKPRNVVVSRDAASALGGAWPLVSAGSVEAGRGLLELLLLQGQHCEWQAAMQELRTEQERAQRAADRSPSSAPQAQRAAWEGAMSGGCVATGAVETAAVATDGVAGAPRVRPEPWRNIDEDRGAREGAWQHQAPDEGWGDRLQGGEHPPDIAAHRAHEETTPLGHWIGAGGAGQSTMLDVDRRVDDPYHELWICSLLQKLPSRAQDRPVLHVMQDLASLRLLRNGHPQPTSPSPHSDRDVHGGFSPGLHQQHRASMESERGIRYWGVRGDSAGSLGQGPAWPPRKQR